MTIKQVILARSDLEMPPGKLAAQVAHASMVWLSRRAMMRPVLFTEAEAYWMGGEFTKIVLRVSSEQQLLNFYKRAHNLHMCKFDMGCPVPCPRKLQSHLITDAGHTVFEGVPTNTCVGIGPDFAEKIDPITGKLELY